jgi:hypothetical protein
MGPTGNAARYGQNYTPKPSQPAGLPYGARGLGVAFEAIE